MNYSRIEHTSDVGLHIQGLSLEDLFINAAKGLYYLAHIHNSVPQKEISHKIEFKADDLETLFVNWLNDIIFKLYIKKIIYNTFDVSIRHHKNYVILNANLKGIELVSFQADTEIKAATYHRLKIEQHNKKYTTEVIFDV